MIEYKKSTLVRQSLSEIKLGRGLGICNEKNTPANYRAIIFLNDFEHSIIYST